jgi:hypothetical protein
VIAEPDRYRMLVVPLCGQRVLQRPEAIGICGLGDLRGRDPSELMHEINLQTGRPVWRALPTLRAHQNLVGVAEQADARVDAD